MTCSRPSGRTTTESRFIQSRTASAATTGRSCRGLAVARPSRHCSRSSARTPRRWDAAFRALPEIKHAAEYDWQAREREERRERECFALSDDDADAARAFGCLLELGGINGRDHPYVTDAEWLADRLVQKIAAHVAAEEDRTERARAASSRSGRAPTTRRRRHDANRGSVTTTRAWLPAAATSTSALRSPGGSQRSTRTR
jgi:hypothetical protein